MNDLDLRSCLESWPYDAERNVRMGRGVDGREIIWVRKPMGIEQYEVDGRPDGWRVHGMETVLDFHHARINGVKPTQPAMLFDLTAEDCTEVFREAAAYFHRLVVLFRLKEWRRVERDAAHILRLLDFVEQHARCAEDRVQLDSWRPRATHINATARALNLLEKGRYQEAHTIAGDALGISMALDDAAPGHRKLADLLLESVRSSLTDCPTLHSHGESCFQRQDDYWTIRYHGQTAFLKATRGLHCIACLIRFPGREFHVSELVAGPLETPVAASAVMVSKCQQPNGNQRLTNGFNDGIPMLDARAKTECKHQLDRLRQELEEAEEFNNPDRAAKIQEEMCAITDHLAAAFGLGGRDRKTSSEAERARCAVTKRIKNAIEKIGDTIPLLGHHLEARIKTGYFCSYNPHPDRPVVWQF